METGEVFGWLVFLFFISVLFFAAFGNASVTEDTVEEYINNLMAEDNKNPNNKR